jgi:hypothetical protein
VEQLRRNIGGKERMLSSVLAVKVAELTAIRKITLELVRSFRRKNVFQSFHEYRYSRIHV